jgi:tight adherence protein C
VKTMLIIILLILTVLLFISISMILRMILEEHQEVSLRLEFIKNDLVDYKEETKVKNLGIKNSFHALVKKLSGVLGKFTPYGIMEAYERKVKLSGRPFKMSAQDWIAIHIGLVGLIPFITIFFLWGSGRSALVLFLVLIEIFFGLGVPRFILGKKQRLRLEKIQDDLPSTLDLLSICVEAGSSLDGAMVKVVEKMEGPIAEEFDILLKEVKLGSSRIEAFKEMVQRVPLEDMKSFVRAMIQAEKSGSRIGNILKSISEDIRENKKMRLKTKIGKAVIKILIPIVLFIMPTTAIIVMGPVVLRLVRMIAGQKFF